VPRGRPGRPAFRLARCGKGRSIVTAYSAGGGSGGKPGSTEADSSEDPVIMAAKINAAAVRAAADTSAASTAAATAAAAATSAWATVAAGVCTGMIGGALIGGAIWCLPHQQQVEKAIQAAWMAAAAACGCGAGCRAAAAAEGRPAAGGGGGGGGGRPAVAADAVHSTAGMVSAGVSVRVARSAAEAAACRGR
jgi:hypothetical protein